MPTALPSYIANVPWRSRLVPASFKGSSFHMEQCVFISGRRIALHEYPKRNDPLAEDLGKRARRIQIVGYILGRDYDIDRNTLKDQLENEGSGILRVQQGGSNIWQMRCVVEEFTVTETRERGGYCVFDMRFVEVGLAANQPNTSGTAAVVNQQAANLINQSQGSFGLALAQLTPTGSQGSFGIFGPGSR